MTAGGPTGVLPVAKPTGPTSHDVVAMARRGLRTRRVGHAGTLDPFASGLLLLCVGRATRLSAILTGLDKEYRAEAVLGVRTDSHDPEGVVLETTSDVELTDQAIEGALGSLRGEQLQRPPAHSAKKVQGEAAHRRVRRGETVVLPPVPVTVHELEMTWREGPRLGLRVRCSAGTYVRAIARDLGELLGVGAHLSALHRTAIGDFSIAEAVEVDALERVPAERWITPAAAARRAGLPWFAVGEGAAAEVGAGRRIPVTELRGGTGAVVAAVDGDHLLALGELVDREFQPRRVFVEP